MLQKEYDLSQAEGVESYWDDLMTICTDKLMQVAFLLLCFAPLTETAAKSDNILSWLSQLAQGAHEGARAT